MILLGRLIQVQIHEVSQLSRLLAPFVRLGIFDGCIRENMEVVFGNGNLWTLRPNLSYLYLQFSVFDEILISNFEESGFSFAGDLDRLEARTPIFQTHTQMVHISLTQNVLVCQLV